MRQILLKRAEHVRPDPDRPGQLLCLHLKEPMTVEEGMNFVRLPALEVLSGGAARFRYSLPKHLAERGVFLLGAYEEHGEITAYMVSMVGGVRFEPKDPVLCVESYSPDSLLPVEGDTKFQNGVLVLDPGLGKAGAAKKKRRKRKA